MTSDARRWVPVLAAADIAPGSVAEAAVGDRDLVVWRTHDGRACVFDARCPHQWSHLGAEGVVDGDELVCTAHFWRFSCDGTGTKLAMSGRRHPKADAGVVPCREVDGRIEVGLPPEGGAGGSPSTCP
jgi:phenylpropionate dioxygenase-like ring-hydroxylating dioxygenase large terminal subunit